eukprot:gene15379-20734_t
MIISGFVTFLFLLGVTSVPYGRHFTSTSALSATSQHLERKSFLTIVKEIVFKYLFLDYRIPAKYGWMIMESPNLIVPIIILYALHLNHAYEIINEIRSIDEIYYTNFLLLSLFLIHYIHRTLIFPLFIRSGNPMPVSVMLSALCYTTWNSLNHSLALILIYEYPRTWLYTLKFKVGVIIFIIGMFININSDYKLIEMRKRNIPTHGRKYSIPFGGLFEYVSCANYFGELVEWGGFAIACWSLPGLAFFVYTGCNLIPRAIHHHHWYKQQFLDYPKSRKSIIPFIL